MGQACNNLNVRLVLSCQVVSRLVILAFVKVIHPMRFDPSSIVVLNSAAELGATIRTVRVATGLRQADAAALCGVSEPFLNELEKGKPTVRLDSVLKVCTGLGITLALKLATPLPANAPTTLKRGPKPGASR